MLRKPYMQALGAVIAAAAMISPALAQVQLTYPQGPLTGGNGGPPPHRHHWRSICVNGFVWREAVPGDHVCVTPGTRAEAADDNAHAGMRVSVHNQSYGPDTCKQGYVWREATPDDHVCVTPGTRDQTADDNAHAGDRILR
jgi:rubredoxin